VSSLQRKLLALVPVGALLVALSSVTLPYYSEGPGPAKDVEPLIDVSGPPLYQSEGRFVLTSVRFQPLSAFGVAGAWADPDRAVIPRSALVFPGESQLEADQRSVSQMDESKIDASVVVLTRLKGYPDHRGNGALVESVVPGCAADDLLFPGDLILSIQGREVADVSVLRQILRQAESGAGGVSQPLDVRVSAGGETTTVSVTPRPCGDIRRPVLGIAAVNNFPFPISISSGDIGGPSAGLMWALGLYDLLTPGDLTAGRTIAGTGEIAVNESVLPIGGVQQKVRAAKAAGATVFLVPAANFAEARPVAGGIRLVRVRDLQDALDFLHGS